MINLNRRRFLISAGLGGLGLALAPRIALARIPGNKRMIVLVLRGGMDGLAAVPPYADPAYAATRGALALAAPGKSGGMIDLDGRFGLHPALQSAMPLWRAGEMQVLHATATPYRERSHFDAQNVLENGGAGPSGSATGWLNRAVAVAGGTGLAVGLAVPLLLTGPASVTTWSPQILPAPDGVLLDTLDRFYAEDALFHAMLAEARETSVMAAGAGMEPATPGSMAAGAKQLEPLVVGLARLLRDREGPRVATIDLLGWDTHANQGVTDGRLAAALRPVADGAVLLKTELGPAVWRDTLVIAVTEFGRTAAPNGTGGTDHGTASAAFIFGGNLDGAKIHGQWPGLDKAQLLDGRDLAPTTDLRRLYLASLINHLGLPAADVAARVFPDSAGLRPLDGVVRA